MDTEKISALQKERADTERAQVEPDSGSWIWSVPEFPPDIRTEFEMHDQAAVFVHQPSFDELERSQSTFQAEFNAVVTLLFASVVGILISLIAILLGVDLRFALIALYPGLTLGIWALLLVQFLWRTRRQKSVPADQNSP